MLDLSIKFPQEMAERLVRVFERALTIIEFHFPTPDTETAWREIAKKAELSSKVKPATVNDYDPDYGAKLALADERYTARTGKKATYSIELIEDMEQVEEDWRDYDEGH